MTKAQNAPKAVREVSGPGEAKTGFERRRITVAVFFFGISVTHCRKMAYDALVLRLASQNLNKTAGVVRCVMCGASFRG